MLPPAVVGNLSRQLVLSKSSLARYYAGRRDVYFPALPSIEESKGFRKEYHMHCKRIFISPMAMVIGDLGSESSGFLWEMAVIQKRSP